MFIPTQGALHANRLYGFCQVSGRRALRRSLEGVLIRTDGHKPDRSAGVMGVFRSGFEGSWGGSGGFWRGNEAVWRGPEEFRYVMAE